ncbi:reverse transcriptase domain-containing protein [Xanthomarina sp. F1114]|uniref:reverse transcriptase domain-containing protein n=1 Tax=Xanthomarina sp. F1114 TaxID=2996019 RepID=UPI00225DDE81|nr:reverse transcriptase domain-containing protein [Xanthomarina sp. F1114]MCX7547772.1 reverse transcriptase domain-containing protein [Xanthomarina sp. F1114]
MAKTDWFKLKKYPHIGLPLQPSEKGKLIAYVKNKNNIAKHRFTPFIHRQIKQRKYRATSKDNKNAYGKRVREKLDPKDRPIFFASHLDSLVYSYYSHLITKAYERYLKHKPYRYSAVAYRKIPKGHGKKGNKCNIEFAKEAFEFIDANRTKAMTVIVADVTSFFDNLDHKILHQKWKEVMGKKNAKGELIMTDDHYNVYKSLINKRYVNEHEMHNRFFKRLWVERGELNNPDVKVKKRKQVRKKRNYKRENVIAFCTKKEFFNRHLDLIRSVKKCSHQHQICRGTCPMKGIPQGSPMSATLANVYMLDFDKLMYETVTNIGGFYQRYSDDLILICEQKDEAELKQIMVEGITQLCKLDIQEKKTQTYRYSPEGGVFSGGIVDPDNTVNPDKQLEYLGFEYNGTNVYVKTVGFSKFYRGMIRSIKRGKFYASKAHHSSKGLFKERLIKRFTILGGKRRLKRVLDPANPGKYKKDPLKRYDWGNYFSYLLKANEAMKDLNGGEDTIKRQSRKIEGNFHRALKHPDTKLKQRSKR